MSYFHLQQHFLEANGEAAPLLGNAFNAMQTVVAEYGGSVHHIFKIMAPCQQGLSGIGTPNPPLSTPIYINYGLVDREEVLQNAVISSESSLDTLQNPWGFQ
jgi:hypothetical protein